MKISLPVYLLIIFCSATIVTLIGSGCAQIGMPTGGAKDTIPPVLLNASPAMKATNFTGRKITLTFNEYIEIQDAQTNVLVSPLPGRNPEINYRFKTVTVNFKDSLQTNTTYSLSFGNAIKDLNEGNLFSNFTYVFSTGATIDSQIVSGKIIHAETGKTDSTIIAMLYRNANDSSVQKRKPDYIARLKGDGSFTFTNLPKDNFNIYALKDVDGSKTYNAKTEVFAFLGNAISTENSNDSIQLSAFAEEKEKKPTPIIKTTEKKLKYLIPDGVAQDILKPFTIQFNNPLKKADLASFQLLDTNYNAIVGPIASLDSTNRIVRITHKWKEGEPYRVIINKDSFADSADAKLAKTDTLKLTAKNESDYGKVVLRFKNFDTAKNMVLQFVRGTEIAESITLTAAEWTNPLFIPGDYELRILFDTNKNGKWDTGNYSKKIQPEKVITLEQKLNVKSNWDNERDIIL